MHRRSFLLRSVQCAAATAALGNSGMWALDAPQQSVEERAKEFLTKFVGEWLSLDTALSEAAWKLATDVTDAHEIDVVRKQDAVDAHLGASEVINQVRSLLEQQDELEDATVRQLKKLLLKASKVPGTIPDVVKIRSRAEARQQSLQDSYVYTLPSDGEGENTLSANQIDDVLLESTSLPVRRAVWESSKRIGERLRSGLLWLRELRNRVASEMGFKSYFALQVADYDMSVEELMAMNEGFIRDIRPLYVQLHTWAKHALAKRYGEDNVPAADIPAHWLPNRWGQNWPGLVDANSMDAPLADKPREFVIKAAEAFYVSLGFDALPRTFHEKSDLYPLASDSMRKKNGHATAWHINYDQDVRSIMSIEANSYWFTTAHHELGHIYYYLAYSKPRVPHLLRDGANRAFHEGIGDLIGLAASQPKYLKAIGLLPDGAPPLDAIEWLLEPALTKNAVAYLPFAAGTMTRFEHDFYAGTIPDAAVNQAWWDIASHYQGIAPPDDRSEKFCDPATKTHINDDPAQYYDYAIGTVIKFQLHDYIAREILREDPRNCNYAGNREVGQFLRNILEKGATQEWRSVLKEATGSELTAKPMLDYFAPLLEWLKEQNAGRTVGW